MKIGITGDPHGDYKTIDKIMQKEKDINLFFSTGDVVDVSGDYWSPIKPFYFAHGNHENFDIIEKLDSGETYIGNFFHIKPDKKYIFKDGKESFSVIGFGGNYAPTKYNLPRPTGFHGFDYKDPRRHFHMCDTEKTKSLGHADILLTHEAPIPYKIQRQSGKIDEAGIPIINEIKKAVNPKLHFFGHHHRKFVNGNSVGLPYPKKAYIIVDIEKWKWQWKDI